MAEDTQTLEIFHAIVRATRTVAPKDVPAAVEKVRQILAQAPSRASAERQETPRRTREEKAGRDRAES